jgi:hypothetical protein
MQYSTALINSESTMGQIVMGSHQIRQVLVEEDLEIIVGRLGLWIPKDSKNTDHQIIVFELQVLLGWIVEKLSTDLSRDDMCPDQVVFGQTKSHLFQDKLDLLALIHRSIGLDLQGLHDRSSAEDIPIGLPDISEDLCEASPLNFHVYFTLGDSPQSLDKLDL